MDADHAPIAVHERDFRVLDLALARFAAQAPALFVAGHLAFTLADPYRVVIDIPQVSFQLPPGVGTAGRGLIKAFRYGLVMPGGSRIVFDSKPIVPNTNGYCDRAGFGDWKFCETRPEGHPERVACDYLATGKELASDDSGGGLNSRISNWKTAVINAMAEFQNDFRCITMDQRNANGGESTGPVPVENAWDAFADDQLGLMDHLGIHEFLFMGYCIGGCFAGKLLQRAPQRVVAAVFCQTVGHRPEDPEVMVRHSQQNWLPDFRARRKASCSAGIAPASTPAHVRARPSR